MAGVQALAAIWTLVGLLATALFALSSQLRSFEPSVGTQFSDLTTEPNRGFGEVKTDLAMFKARLDEPGY